MKRKNNFVNYDKKHLINIENGMIIKKEANLKDIKHKDIMGFDILIKNNNKKGK